MSKLSNWKQRALYYLMSDISEDCYAAGWMSGNEYTLWSMVADSNASRDYGMQTVDEERIDDLRAIADEIGGWIYWHDDDDDPEESGPRFIPMAEWLTKYQRHYQGEPR